MDASTAVVRQPGPSLRVSIALIVIGVLAAVPAVIRLAGDVAHALTSPAYATPARFTRHLGKGRYVVFEHTGTRRGGEGFTFFRNGPITLPAPQVRVTASDGTALETRQMTSNETITKGSRIYAGAVRFDTPAAGKYVIQVQGGHGDVLVARALGDTFGRVGAWLIPAGIGVLVALTGQAMLIIGVIRRNRVETAERRAHAPAGPWPPIANMPPPTLPPGGWYPDPSGEPGKRRFWDGTKWTDHVG